MEEHKSLKGIFIPPLEMENLTIPIVGTSPLIVHNFSEKSKRQLAGIHNAGNKIKGKKEPRNPEEEFNAARYLTKAGEDGFPITAFKRAFLRGGKVHGMEMVTLAGLIFFHPDKGEEESRLVTISCPKGPIMREDPVRVASGGTDLRYRPQYWPWSINLRVSFDKSMLDIDQVYALLDRAGRSVGVGEWRPERKGDNGCFTIART